MMLDASPIRARRHLVGPSTVRKRSVVIAKQKTSVSLEEPFWKGLKAIAEDRGVKITHLLGELDADRPLGSTLSSAARVFVLMELRKRHDVLSAAIWG